MNSRTLLILLLLGTLFLGTSIAPVTAQDSPIDGVGSSAFQPPNIGTATTPPSLSPKQTPAPQPKSAGNLSPTAIARQPVNSAPLSSLPSQLPRSHGQEYRTYDITPYTSRVEGVDNPQQAVIDWILRETGRDIWFLGPAAFLNADRQQLRVYHTPEVQAVVRQTLDRFLATRGQSYVMSMRLVTVGSPNWRAKALSMLKAVNVETPGIEAWMVSKENAAVLLGDLKKRADCQEHNSPNVVIHNGQYHTVSRRQPRSFVRSVRPRADSYTGYDLDMGQFNEGYSLELSPLFSVDGKTIDGVLKCSVDQVERFVNIPIDVPVISGGRQRVQVQVPQVVSWRLHERFRWPVDQVLLLSCGVVAMPGPERKNALDTPLTNPFGIRFPLGKTPGRADALLLIECKGKGDELLIDAQRTANRGRSTTGTGLLQR